jgi:hypothetical protein
MYNRRRLVIEYVMFVMLCVLRYFRVFSVITSIFINLTLVTSLCSEMWQIKGSDIICFTELMH